MNFSGGKDSLVVLDLASRVFRPGELKIVYVEVTGNTARCNVDYVYRVRERYYSEYELVHIRPPFDFFELMVRNGVPNPKTRWCMNRYKIQYLRKLLPPFHIIGVKKTDSRRCSMIYVKHIQKLKYGGIGIFPLLNWTTTDVYDYIKQYGLELSPCYKRYGHSGNCLVPDTFVVMADYIVKTIKDISIGDKVLTYNITKGHVEPGVVKHKFVRKYKGKIIKIKTHGLYELKLTPEHPIYVCIKRRFSTRPYCRLVQCRWMTAQELCKFYKKEKERKTWLKRPYIVYPFLNETLRHTYLSDDLLYFIGAYVAEGCIREDREVRFNLGRHEDAFANRLSSIFKKIYGRECKIKDRPNESELLLKFYSSDLARLIRSLVAGKAVDKRISVELLSIQPEKQVYLLKGMLDGDGCYHEGKNKIIIYTTASPHLAFQVHLLFLRQGLMAQLITQSGSKYKPNKRYFRIQHYVSNRHYGMILHERSISLYAIKSIDVEEYRGLVYNLEVEPNNNYITQGGLVHNCMFCPFMSKKQASRVLQDPYWREKIITALKQIRSLYDNRNSKFKQRIIRYWLKNPVLYNHKIIEYITNKIEVLGMNHGRN